jgi:hypothetical protein
MSGLVAPERKTKPTTNSVDPRTRDVAGKISRPSGAFTAE